MVPLSTLHDVLYGEGAPDGAAVVLTDKGPKLSRGDLYAAVVETALALQRAGVKPGDVVSMAYANTVRSPFVHLPISLPANAHLRACSGVVPSALVTCNTELPHTDRLRGSLSGCDLRARRCGTPQRSLQAGGFL